MGSEECETRSVRNLKPSIRAIAKVNRIFEELASPVCGEILFLESQLRLIGRRPIRYHLRSRMLEGAEL